MQRILCLAGILALLGVAKPHVGLGTFVKSVLPHAAQNFAGLRGAKYDSDTYYVEYKIVPGKLTCKTCRVWDQYARGTYRENWYLEDRWKSDWTTAKTEAYVMTQLRPILSGYALHRTVKYSYPTLVWRNAANSWVYVDLYKSGFTLRVGQDLTKAAHVLNPPSKVQLQQLANATSNMMRLALPDAVNNFASLRGTGKKKDILGEDSYPLNASFGPMFHKCDISDVANGFGYKDFQPKWILNCETVAMAGTKAALEETVRRAVYDALPGSYTSVTDSAALLLDDYRWDNSDSRVSVNIGSYEGDGVVSFNISILHFTPK